jgi:predicted lipoprotein with Yx(FWY)xxD motif
LTIIDRPDGTYQVANNGMPLYRWQGDKSPGDTTGNGVGGVWSVAKP